MKKDTSIAFCFGFLSGACFSAAIVTLGHAFILCRRGKDAEVDLRDGKDSEYAASTNDFVSKMKNEHALKDAFDETKDIKCEDQLDNMQKMIYDEKYNKPLDLASMDLSGLNDE